MSTRTVVTLPDGSEVPLATLATRTDLVCDGCGSATGYAGNPLIVADITITVAESDGEGARIAAHLCGRPQCELSAFARHFEALWPLPDVRPS